ncbi:hypothetical protein KKD72_00275 [Patescibacteria group bacterium]|nr:hypothetical protein [Patescibacteria group bacterium]
MLAKFLLITSIIFGSLVSLFDGLPIKEQAVEPQKLPLALEGSSLLDVAGWRIQSAAISAITENNPNFLPIRDWEINDPQIEAKSAIIFNSNKDRILYQKNPGEVLPIASLTKLMTATLAIENLGTNEIVSISQKAIDGYGEKGGLMQNEKITVGNLLNILLMESSNDAAIALAEAVEQTTGRNFIDLMNETAIDLDLKNTHFTDPSGYDVDNISTVSDIVFLVKYTFSQPFLWKILKTPTKEVFSADKKIRHNLINTDELLNRLPNVVGGKTGYTDEAQGCLVLVIDKNGEYLINVVLGAQERFLETEKLINWVGKAYRW